MYNDEAVEVYQELRQAGLYPEEAAELMYDGTYSAPGPTEPWRVILGLAMMFICLFAVFLGG